MNLSPNKGELQDPGNSMPGDRNVHGNEKQLYCPPGFYRREQGGPEQMGEEENIEDDADIRNDLWVKENYVGLCDEFPNQWIAVADQDVIASGISKRQVTKKAEEVAGGRRYSIYFMEPSALPP